MFLKPVLPPYDPLEWGKKPFPEKSRMVCEAWAMQGYGTPLGVYLVYAVKVLLYAGGWLFFCGFTPGMGSLANIASWWLEPEAFKKAILWSLLFEVLGFGCGSGPLTGRYVPPIGGALYFLRPGTTKLPVFEKAPLIGGSRRSSVDVLLYATNGALIVAALVSAHPGNELLLPIAVLLPLLGVLDKTVFLAARGEHYWTTIMVMVLSSNFIPGAKGVQAALWFWAGFSKLNHHFPAVVGVMTSNSPLTASNSCAPFRSNAPSTKASSAASWSRRSPSGGRRCTTASSTRRADCSRRGTPTCASSAPGSPGERWRLSLLPHHRPFTVNNYAVNPFHPEPSDEIAERLLDVG